MKYITIFSFTLVAFCNFSYAQVTKISGTILEDSTSAPLQDVQIINIKSRKSSFTDVSGNFVLYADIGDSIEIGLTGYNTKNLLVNQLDIGKVFLQKNELSLKDVIITTALGIKRNQNTLPYAVLSLLHKYGGFFKLVLHFGISDELLYNQNIKNMEKCSGELRKHK